MNDRPEVSIPKQESQLRIADAFNGYFEAFGIRIGVEDVVVGTQRTLRQDGWAITYGVNEDADGRLSLEFYATHRMTNDRHVVISSDGQLEHQDSIREMLIFDPKVPGSQEAAVEEFHAHNRAVEQRLRDRGMYPHGQAQRSV